MDKYLFGPVPSRRLGISLGLDIIPYKTCTLDCLYCECGKTNNHSLVRKSFFPPEKLLSETDIFLKKKIHLDYITFAGSGEPTLNSDIGYMIKKLKRITNTPIAVLTNGTLLDRPKVREDLLLSDLLLPSLDAVSEDVFKKINNPVEGITAKQLVKGLIDFSKIYKGKIWVEVFISKGINDSVEELGRIRKVLEQIDPARIQLNSLDRPPAYTEAKTAGHKLLTSIMDSWKDLPVEIIKRVKTRDEIPSFSKNLENSIMNTIVRRPLTLEDLITLTGKNRLELNKYIDILEKEKTIRTEIVGEKIFFRPYSET